MQFIGSLRPFIVSLRRTVLFAGVCACGSAGTVMEPAQSSAAGTPIVRDGIEYVGAVSQSADSVRATLTVTNRSARDQELPVGSGCTVVLRLYGNTSKDERPVWDGLERRLCVDRLVIIVVKPGETRRFEDTVSKDARDGWGQEFPTGPVRARAWIRTSSEFEVDIGPITVQR